MSVYTYIIMVLYMPRSQPLTTNVPYICSYLQKGNCSNLQQWVVIIIFTYVFTYVFSIFLALPLHMPFLLIQIHVHITEKPVNENYKEPVCDKKVTTKNTEKIKSYGKIR